MVIYRKKKKIDVKFNKKTLISPISVLSLKLGQ